MDGAAYQRVLGDEIRKLRKSRGWTRKELNARLPSGISLQTLATYELGTRRCSVLRFVEICLALGEPPHRLLARVQARVVPDDPAGGVRLDLRRVARERSPELVPLRRWAVERLGGRDGARPVPVHLDVDAVARMAELCGLPAPDLLARLRALSDAPEPPHD